MTPVQRPWRPSSNVWFPALTPPKKTHKKKIEFEIFTFERAEQVKSFIESKREREN